MTAAAAFRRSVARPARRWFFSGGRDERPSTGPIGTVVHLAARLAEEAQGGQILISQRVQLAVETVVQCTILGEQTISGFLKPLHIFVVERLRAAGRTDPVEWHQTIRCKRPAYGARGEVVGLIVHGCTNREIAQELIIAEGTAVHNVANILKRLGLKSRA